MGRLSNALRGNLNDDGGPRKGKSDRQLDLFMTLSDRAAGENRDAGVPIKAPEPKSVEAAPPEPKLVLPVSPLPGDVSAEVRAVLSDGEPGHPSISTQPDGEGRPPIRTGVYRRPRRSPMAPPSAEPVPPRPAPAPRAAPTAKRRFPMAAVREWFEGVEWDRRMTGIVSGAFVVVALLAFWSACPRRQPETGTAVDLGEVELAGSAANEAVVEPPSPDPAPAPDPASPAAAPAPVPAPAAPPVPTAPVAPKVDIKISAARTTEVDGGYNLVFEDPVFVSADNISKEGWAALQALAKKLVKMKDGGTVIVTGHTDDVPLSRPTPQFRDNADLAAARAKTAREHLAHFARANRNLTFEERTGTLADAPYPNDSTANRRLNRTATVRVVPAGAGQ
jgi:hypothetical protein